MKQASESHLDIFFFFFYIFLHCSYVFLSLFFPCSSFFGRSLLISWAPYDERAALSPGVSEQKDVFKFPHVNQELISH